LTTIREKLERETVDFTRGIADRIYDTPEDHTAYFNEFVTRTLDSRDLYCDLTGMAGVRCQQLCGPGNSQPAPFGCQQHCPGKIRPGGSRGGWDR